MYNLNTSLTTPLLGVDITHTPRTPEILNSLIAMTNPLEYSFSSVNSGSSHLASNLGSNYQPSGNDYQMNSNATKDSSFLHQFDTQSNCSSSSVESPATTPTTPSIQQVVCWSFFLYILIHFLFFSSSSCSIFSILHTLQKNNKNYDIIYIYFTVLCQLVVIYLIFF